MSAPETTTTTCTATSATPTPPYMPPPPQGGEGVVVEVEAAPTTTKTAATPPPLEVTNPEPEAESLVSVHQYSRRQPQQPAARSSDEEEEDDDEHPPATGCSKFCRKWKYVFIIIGLSFLNGMSGIVMNPILPGIKRRYFGSDKEAAFYTTVLQAVSCALALVLCPLSGYAMDFFGRRPFFLASTGLGFFPPLMLLVFYPNPWPYMIASSITTLVSGSYTATYIADHYNTDKTRMMAFAFVTGAANLSTGFGFVAGLISDYAGVIISVSFAGAAFIYVFFMIEESLPKEKLRGGVQLVESTVVNADGSTSVVEELVMGKFDWSRVENPFKAMKAVMDSKITIVTIIIMGIFTVSQTGVGEVYFYYLNERVGFDKADNGYVLLEAGLMWPLVLFLVVPFCKKVLKAHSVTLVMFSIGCLAVELTLMCIVNAKWQIFAFTLPAAAMVNMSFPALTTIIADGSTGEDQGRRQTGLAAMGDFFGTLAPLFFGLLYSHTDASLSFLPFAIAAVLTIPALILAYKLRRWMVVMGQRNISRNSSSLPTPRASSQKFTLDADDEAKDQTSVDVEPLLANSVNNYGGDM